MNETPKWHGWATPEQVRKMMDEMYSFLKANDEKCNFWKINPEWDEILEQSAELWKQWGKLRADIRHIVPEMR